MAVSIRQIHPVFVGEVSGFGVRQPLTPSEIAAIEDGMDGCAVQFDLVMWDNRQTMHHVRRFDVAKVRDTRRTTVAGDTPTAEQVAA